MGAYFLQAFGKGLCQLLWKSKWILSIGSLLSACSLNSPKKFLDRQVGISFQTSNVESALQCAIYSCIFCILYYRFYSFFRLNAISQIPLEQKLFEFSFTVPSTQFVKVLFPDLSLPVCTALCLSLFSKFSVSTTEMHFKLSSKLRYRAESMAWV